MAAFRRAGRALHRPSMAGSLRRAVAESEQQQRRRGLELLQHYCSSSPRGFHSLHRPAATATPVSTMGSTGSPRCIASSERWKLYEETKKKEELERKGDDENRTKKRNALVSTLMKEPGYGTYGKTLAINDQLAQLEPTGNNGGQELRSEEELWDLLANKKEEMLVELFKEDGQSKEKGEELAAVARRLKDVLTRQQENMDWRDLNYRAARHTVWLTTLTAAVFYLIFKG